MASKKKTYKPVVPDTSGGSLADYKFNATVNNRRPQTSINTQNAAKAKGPKPPSKKELAADAAYKFLRNDTMSKQSIIDELKYVSDWRNVSGVNAIEAAIKGEGMSTTERITTGLTGIVQGLAFAYTGKPAKPRTVLMHGGPEILEGGVINPAKTATAPKYQHQGTTTAKLNDIELAHIESRSIPQMETNVAALKRDMTTPGTFSYNNPQKTLESISGYERSLAKQRQWLGEAKKNNYFTAVSEAGEAYKSVGATHVFTPEPSQVNTSRLTPGEYQVVGTHKPVKTFPKGKTVAEEFAINKQINDYAAMLRAPQRTIPPVIATIQPKPIKKK